MVSSAARAVLADQLDAQALDPELALAAQRKDQRFLRSRTLRFGELCGRRLRASSPFSPSAW